MPAETIKALMEKRAKVANEARQIREKILAEKRRMTAEENRDWIIRMGGEDAEGKQVRGEVDLIGDEIKQETRQDEVDAQLKASTDPKLAKAFAGGAIPPDERQDPLPAAKGPTEEQRALAMRAWVSARMSNFQMSEKHVEACRSAGINPNANEIVFNVWPTQQFRAMQAAHRDNPKKLLTRALSDVSGPAGAYTTAPETLVRNLERAMLQFGGILQVAETIRTSTGERLTWPTTNTTTQRGRRIQENTAAKTDGSLITEPSIGKVSWDAYTYTSDAILVPYDLLNDSVFDLASILGEMLGERLGRALNYECTVGTGASMPTGIVPAATVGKTTASATALAFDELIDLEHSVDPAYRADPGCGYMLHDNIVAVLRKLKNGQGGYLWNESTQMGVPDKINGYPYTINQDMQSSLVTATRTVLFGVLSKYKVRQVNQIRLYRLPELFRLSDQDGFLAFGRWDGNLLDAGTHPVKAMLQA